MNGAESEKDAADGIIRYSETTLPTLYGNFRCIVFRDANAVEHVAMVAGDVCGEAVLCSVHDECLTSDVLGSTQCRCKADLEIALKTVADVGRGVVVYLREEGEGMGVGERICAVAIQVSEGETARPNHRKRCVARTPHGDIALQILDALGVTSTLPIAADERMKKSA